MSEEEWLSDEDLKAAMDVERQVYGKELNAAGTVGTARRLFAENSAAAANSIINLAKHGSNENIRFRAAQYVLERSLGPAKAAGAYDNNMGPLEEALQQLMEHGK